MGEPIEFYFDFASPYGYLASHRIDALAERFGRTVAWMPFMVGAAFKVTGSGPVVNAPIKGAYASRDIARAARRLGVPFQFPAGFPHATLSPARAYYWLAATDAAAAKSFARAAFLAYFGDGRDISRPEVTADVAASLGGDPEALARAIQEPAVKAQLRAVTDAAIERGVFGSPFVFVDGEPFWGHDRLDDVAAWLESGGW